MPTIKVQKIPRKKADPDELIITFCYYFPQYTYWQAKKIPFVRIIKMLKVVKKEQALKYRTLTRIASANHTKNGSFFKTLIEEFNAIINP